MKFKILETDVYDEGKRWKGTSSYPPLQYAVTQMIGIVEKSEDSGEILAQTVVKNDFPRLKTLCSDA